MPSPGKYKPIGFKTNPKKSPKKALTAAYIGPNVIAHIEVGTKVRLICSNAVFADNTRAKTSSAKNIAARATFLVVKNDFCIKKHTLP